MIEEIIIYNILFWPPYYWVCTLPERSVQYSLDGVDDAGI